MSEAIKADQDEAAHGAEGDVLHFLSRTLQAHILDSGPKGALEKLQNLMLALEQQEKTLSSWPDSASKARMCAALAKAMDTVSKLVDDLASPEAAPRSIRAAKAM